MPERAARWQIPESELELRKLRAQWFGEQVDENKVVVSAYFSGRAKEEEKETGRGRRKEREKPSDAKPKAKENADPLTQGKGKKGKGKGIF